MQPKNLSSTFIYTETHITDVVIPELKSIADHYKEINLIDSANYFLNQLRVWEQVVEANHKTIEDADNVEVISFSGGAGYTKTLSTSVSESKTFDWSIYLDVGVAVEAGYTGGGIGVVGGVAVAGRTTWGKISFGETEKTNTVGYYLGDDDLGDDYMVQVLTDKVYGTPAFKLISGQTSCPHEPGTVPREATQLSVKSNKNTQSVKETEAAVYVLQLANTSQSDETITYDLFFDHTSNPGGAVITIGGSPVVGGIPYSYTIPAGGIREATITVSKGPINTTYNNLKFTLQSQCDADISSTVLLNTSFYKEHNLNISVNGSGTTNLTGQQTYKEGSIVNLYATPNVGYKFQKWIINSIESTSNPVSITVNGGVNVQAFFIAEEPNAISKNVSENQISVYPNPTKKMVTVKFGNEKVNQIEINSSTGQTVYLKQVNHSISKETIDITTLQTGIYFINLQTENGNIVKKIVKE